MSTLRIKSRDPFWGTVQYLSKIVPSQHVRTFDAQLLETLGRMFVVDAAGNGHPLESCL